MTQASLLSLALLTALILSSSSPAEAEEARARELINALGCKACHSLAGDGGSLGPSLDGVGKHLDRNRLRRQMVAPRDFNPHSAMPSYDTLPEDDLEVLSEFLASLK